jgi:hypothetical protein
MPTPPCPICLEMVQYTPRRDGMVLQVSATDPTHPLSALIGQSRQIQTGQRAIAGDDAKTSLATLTWSDDDIDAAAVAYFAALGIDVTITPNYLSGDAPQDVPVDQPIDQPVDVVPTTPPSTPPTEGAP